MLPLHPKKIYKKKTKEKKKKKKGWGSQRSERRAWATSVLTGSVPPQPAAGKLCFQRITTPPSFIHHPELHTTLFVHISGGTDPKCKTQR